MTHYSRVLHVAPRTGYRTPTRTGRGHGMAWVCGPRRYGYVTQRLGTRRNHRRAGRVSCAAVVCMCVDGANTQRHTHTRRIVHHVLLMLSAYGASASRAAAVWFVRHLLLRCLGHLILDGGLAKQILKEHDVACPSGAGPPKRSAARHCTQRVGLAGRSPTEPLL